MSILNLPFDVQRQIFWLTLPYDFEAYAISCKLIYATSQPLLQQHNTLRKRYRNFKLPKRHIWENDRSVAPYTIPELLGDIAMKPIIAEYIIHLDLANREELGLVLEHSCWARSVRAKIDATADALYQLLRQSTHLRQLNLTPSQFWAWYNCILQENCEVDGRPSADFAGVFLLSLLPNLETLAVSRTWGLTTVAADPEEDEYEFDDATTQARQLLRLVWKLVDLLVDRAKNHTLAGQPLSKLHTLYPTRDVDTQLGHDIISIFPFLALESLRHAYHSDGTLGLSELRIAENGDSDDESATTQDDDITSDDGMHEEGYDDEFEEGYDESDDNASQNDSSLYQIGFACQRFDRLGSSVKHMVLDNCVINTNACYPFFSKMTSLTTLHYRHTTKEELGQEWAADDFMQSLASAIGPSLERLAILADIVWDDCTAIRTPLGKFTKLQHLELDAVFLVKDGGKRAITPLSHLLPSSLRTFILHISSGDSACLKHLFAKFKQSRNKYLPLLENVELHIRSKDRIQCRVEEHEKHVAKITSIADKHGVRVCLVDV